MSAVPGDAVGLWLVLAQWSCLAVLTVVEDYFAKRRERDNRATRDSNQRVINEIRRHFPRFKDNPDEETGI
jgi:hypothetical protein